MCEEASVYCGHIIYIHIYINNCIHWSDLQKHFIRHTSVRFSLRRFCARQPANKWHKWRLDSQHNQGIGGNGWCRGVSLMLFFSCWVLHLVATRMMWIGWYDLNFRFGIRYVVSVSNGLQQLYQSIVCSVYLVLLCMRSEDGSKSIYHTPKVKFSSSKSYHPKKNRFFPTIICSGATIDEINPAPVHMLLVPLFAVFYPRWWKLPSV